VEIFTVELRSSAGHAPSGAGDEIKPGIRLWHQNAAMAAASVVLAGNFAPDSLRFPGQAKRDAGASEPCSSESCPMDCRPIL
jgi:hypothetical protein